jgi:hypothetical protein
MLTSEDVQFYGTSTLEYIEGQEKLFIDTFYTKSEIGRRLVAEGLNTSENLNKIQIAADTSDEPVSFAAFVAAAKRLYLIGSLQSKAQAPVVVEEPKKLTANQLAWQEFRVFSETQTSSECKARAQRDSEYGSFYRKQFEREFAAEQVADAVVPAGQPTAKVKADADLVDFARRYNTTPIAQLKPKGGFVVVGGETMRYEDFLAQQARATNARLI